MFFFLVEVAPDTVDDVRTFGLEDHKSTWQNVHIPFLKIIFYYWNLSNGGARIFWYHRCKP